MSFNADARTSQTASAAKQDVSMPMRDRTSQKASALACLLVFSYIHGSVCRPEVRARLSHGNGDKGG